MEPAELGLLHRAIARQPRAGIGCELAERARTGELRYGAAEAILDQGAPAAAVPFRCFQRVQPRQFPDDQHNAEFRGELPQQFDGGEQSVQRGRCAGEPERVRNAEYPAHHQHGRTGGRAEDSANDHSDSVLMKTVASISAAVIALGIGAFLAPVRAQRAGQAPAAPAGPWMNQSLSPDQRADLLLREMTLEEKLSLVHGTGMIRNGTVSDPALLRSNGGAGFIPGIPRLGIPDLQMADAAVGVARGAQRGRYSTPLPSAVAEAASFDARIAAQYGALIGQELRDQGYTMSLGGGINLTREPRNGRNFEYKGEDPILAGTLAGAEIKALQAQGVIGDIKHYAFNDQETGRNSGSANLEKRAMRETDLLAFEIGIRDSGVGAVMCS